jgi:alkylation response protein AidB-like acyl-CoA dehydrogenase
MTSTVPRHSRSILGPELPVVREDDPFRREFRLWLTDHLPSDPEPSDPHEKIAFRRRWQRTLFEGGWAGPAWPAEYGGRGAGPLQQFMYYEELALARAPNLANEAGIVLLGPTLMVHGRDDLKERFLPGILSGEEIWSQGFSEPNAGSDLAALRTRARLDRGEWIINGQKIWTSWIHSATWSFVLCRTDPESRRHHGLSMLICELDQPEITTRPIIQMNRDSEFGEVFYDAARVPEDLIVGEPGEGWNVAMTMFQFERADQGFTDHARLLVQLDDMIGEFRRAQRESRMPAPEQSAARLTVAELWVRCQQLRQLNLRAAINAQAGAQVGAAGSMVKLFWSELEQDIAALRARVGWIEGLRDDSEIAYDHLASRATTIYSGTSEIQRNIVAERILGLPR